jgi:hypothetical protein
MRAGWIMLAAMATTAAAASSAAAAGCTGTVQVADDFTRVDPAWVGDSLSIGGGKLALEAPAGKTIAANYSGAFFKDADICVDVAVSQPIDPGGPGAALVFWEQDANNYYALYVHPNGTAAILSRQAGKDDMPVAQRKVDSLKPGGRAVNSLRVTLKAGTISAYINDQPFATLQGTAPPNGMIGLVATSERTAPNLWTFTHFKVTTPPP